MVMISGSPSQDVGAISHSELVVSSTACRRRPLTASTSVDGSHCMASIPRVISEWILRAMDLWIHDLTSGSMGMSYAPESL